jgi:5-methylcytosine-specific restriction endonuclease McrA
VLYPATVQFFYKNDRGKYGLQAACRECGRIRNREWLSANKEKRKQYNAKWEAENQERRAKRHKEWARENKETRNAYRQQWCKENADLIASWPSKSPEAQSEYMRQYRKRHREVLLMRNRINQHQRRAGLGYTKEDVYQMYEDQQGLCCYCETPLFGVFEIDHMMPISKGGLNDWENIAIACPLCNHRKSAKTPLQFLRVLGYDVVEETLRRLAA